MTRKIFVVSIILLIVHSLFIMKFDGIGYPTHQMQSNVIRTQQYLYDKSDIAIVGTSLSARILMDSLPENISLLSFGGCTVEDGLNLICAKKEKPKLICVETNLLSRKGTSTFIDQNTKASLVYLRNNLPFLREENQPICLFAGILLKASKINPQVGSVKVDTFILNKSIEATLSQQEIIDKGFELTRLKEIKEKILSLQNQGIKILLFQMPINERLRTYKPYLQKYALVKETFPDCQFMYMADDTNKYVTTDGMHLDYEGQKRYSGFFNKQLKKIYESMILNK